MRAPTKDGRNWWWNTGGWGRSRSRAATVSSASSSEDGSEGDAGEGGEGELPSSTDAAPDNPRSTTAGATADPATAAATTGTAAATLEAAKPSGEAAETPNCSMRSVQ